MEEDITLKKLSKGLGFCNKQISFKDFQSQPIQKNLSLPSVPDFLLQQPLNLKDENTYKYVLAQLKEPWLGEEKAIQMTSVTSSEVVLPEGNANVVSHVSEEFDPLLTDEPFLHEELPSHKESPVESNDVNVQTATSKKELDSAISLHSSPAGLFFKESISLKSYIIDGLLMCVLFFSPLYLCAALTQAQPLSALSALWPYILVCFLIFSQIYCCICRLFCFDTYGEVLSKRRLFYKKNPPHPFHLLWRFIVSCATGVVILPILSMICKRDLSMYLTGLYFQKISEEA